MLTVVCRKNKTLKLFYLNRNIMKKIICLLSMFFGALCAVAQPLQRVAPEQVGMDSRRLLYADELINSAVANEEIPGAVLAIVKDGKMA